MPSDVDPQILWKTSKCVIRGFCIYLSSTLAKAKLHQFTQLENKIQSLQNLQKQRFTEQQATQLSSLKEEYDLLSHSKEEFILHGTRQKYYFESERPSHLLALRLKECESKAYISAIKSSDDQVTTNPVTINDIFKGFTSSHLHIINRIKFMRIWRAVRGEGSELGILARTQSTPKKQHSKGQPPDE